MESLFKSIVGKLLLRLTTITNSYFALVPDSIDTDGRWEEGGSCQYASYHPGG